MVRLHDNHYCVVIYKFLSIFVLIVGEEEKGAEGSVRAPEGGIRQQAPLRPVQVISRTVYKQYSRVVLFQYLGILYDEIIDWQ